MSKLYTQKYRKEWESNPEFKGWLKLFIGDNTRAYCLYCKADFYAKLSDVKKHKTTQKHTQKAKPYDSSTQKNLPFMVKKIDSAKKAEDTMALAIAEHFSMLACDHIGEACRAAFSDSTAATHFKVHRDD
jgi:D-lyxose ketol-isomerase